MTKMHKYHYHSQIKQLTKSGNFWRAGHGKGFPSPVSSTHCQGQLSSSRRKVLHGLSFGPRAVTLELCGEGCELVPGGQEGQIAPGLPVAPTSVYPQTIFLAE